MSINNYTKIKLLGSGTYGRCYLVNNILNNQQCVLKQIEIVGMSEQQKQQSIKQAKILSSLDHPYIIKFTECFLSDQQNTLNIVMGYADGGDLGKKIKQTKNTPFNENLILNLFTQICLAVKHVHDRKIIHRDLKTHNIFLTREGSIKLGDFGIARSLDLTLEKIKTVVGTPHYMSPEICENKEYSLKTDIWSLGVILYELCTHKQPFQANSLAGLALKISKGQYSPLSQSINKDIRKLIAQMLMIDPNKRPTIKQILQHWLIKPRISKLLSNHVRVRQFSSQRSLIIKPFLQDESFNFESVRVNLEKVSNDLKDPLTKSVSPQSVILPILTPQSQNHKLQIKDSCSNKKHNKENKSHALGNNLDKKNKQKSELRRREISEPNLTPKDCKKMKANVSLANLDKKAEARQSRENIPKKRSIRNQSELGMHLQEIKEINRQVNGLRDQLSHRQQDQITQFNNAQGQESGEEQQTILQTIQELIIQKIGYKQYKIMEQHMRNSKGFDSLIGQCGGLLSLLYGLKQTLQN